MRRKSVYAKTREPEFLAKVPARLTPALESGAPPDWVPGYVAKVEEALGDAYKAPAADVRGYIEHVKSQG